MSLPLAERRPARPAPGQDTLPGLPSLCAFLASPIRPLCEKGGGYQGLLSCQSQPACFVESVLALPVPYVDRHYRRAVRSSYPYIRLKFCTATPLAPRTRLSSQASTRI